VEQSVSIDRQSRTAAQSVVQIDGVASPKRYKPSRFNAHTVDDDGALLLFNSFTGHNCVIPTARAEQARHYLSSEGFLGVLDKLGDYLLAKGYVVEASVDEDARWNVRYGQEQYQQNRLDLILLSSEDCNFRCVYCSQEFKRGSMQSEIQQGVLRLVESRVRHLRSMEISWFGGEPLLGYDAIEELAPKLQEQARKYEVSYKSSMTTNGYLLFPERSRNLVKWGVTSYQITLDGTAMQHDSHRPLADGQGTFDQILANLVAMREIPEPFRVAIRFNFDNANLPHAEMLFQALRAALGEDKRFVMRFHAVGQWGGPNDADLDVCGVQDANRHLIQLTAKATAAGLQTEHLVNELLPAPGSVCYAARPYNLIIGSDGKLMKCTMVLDTLKDNVVGQLHPDGNLSVNEDLFAKWVKPYYRDDPMCNKCFFVPTCQGASCPLPRLLTGDRPCPTSKVEIQQTLKDVRRAPATASAR
jgi:uncharacterized protein